MVMRVVLVLAVIAVVAVGANRYVAKTGSDINPGTESAPWLTIRHAAGVVVAGDTVLVGPGVYDEGDTLSLCVNAGPIVFKSTSPRGASIVSELYVNQKNVTLDGFRLVYTRRWASQALKLLADSVTIQNCEVVSEGVAAGGTGVLVGSGHKRGIRIIDNVVHGFNSHGIYASQLRGGVVSRNICYGNVAGNGIQAYPSVESSEVSYNLCYDNGESGVLLHGYYNRVDHNVCYRNGQSGIKLYSDDFYAENHDNVVENNTVYDNNWCGLWVAGHGPNLIWNNVALGNWWCGWGAYVSQLFIDTSAAGKVTLDYNCYWPDDGFHWNGNGGDYDGTFAEYRAATGQDAHGLCADPLFADTAAHDFHLQPGSPCIGAGYGGCDIGAFPFVAESIPETIIPPPDTTKPGRGHKPKPRKGGGSQSDATIYFQRLGNGQVYDATGRKVEGRVIFDNKRKRIVVR